MSVNVYDKTTGQLIPVSGTRKYNFLGTLSEWNALSLAEKVKYDTVDIAPEDSALKFSSDGAFILSVANPYWNGTIEYSTDGGSTWATWDGSQLNGTAQQPIYLRGTGNTKFTRGDSTGSNDAWRFTGKYITGNIEYLLDYQTVKNEEHPTMAAYCYTRLFEGCTSLIKAPKLPAITLTKNCYSSMFLDCSSLIEAPELPATSLAENCYSFMFCDCTSLTAAPKLPATSLAKNCYIDMFRGCSALIKLPKLASTNLLAGCYCRMFYDCSSIKLSTTQSAEYPYEYRIPTTGTGTMPSGALNDMFKNTGGTFKGTPTINTTYYTDHEPV